MKPIPVDRLMKLWLVILTVAVAWLTLFGSPLRAESTRGTFKDELGYRCDQRDTDDSAFCPDNPLYEKR